MNLFLVFEKKLEEIANSLGYDYTNATKKHKILHETWTRYLKELGIGFADNLPQEAARFADPLYTADRWLVIPKDVEERIEVLGLP